MALWERAWRPGSLWGRACSRLFIPCNWLTTIAVMTPAQIRALRKRCRLSQAVFASVLNTSLSTVQKWETGAKRPGGPSLKLLSLIERKGLDVVL